MISIVIPLYNKEDYIGKTIKSILNQSFQDFQIIIVDDGCTDSSVEIVETFEDSRIELIRQLNQGVSIARNNGIINAKYEWIALLDADDYWDPNYLDELRNLIYKFSQHKVFATGYKIKYQNGNEILSRFHQIKQGAQVVLDNYFEIISKSSGPITSSSVCIHKDVFKEIGYFEPQINMGEDQILWSKIALKYPIVLSNKIMVTYFINESSAVKKIVPDENAPYLQQLKKWVRNDLKIPYLPEYYNSQLFYIGRLQILNGEASKGRKLIIESNLRQDFFKKTFWIIVSFGMQLKLQ